MKFSRLPALLLILVLTGAGCWLRPGTETNNSGVNAPALEQIGIEDAYNSCLLLSKTDAEAVIGVAVQEPLHSGAVSDDKLSLVSSCNYASANGEGSENVKVVSLLVRKAATVEDAIRTYEEARAQSLELSGVAPLNVANLGDRAYWTGGALNQMNVLVGQAWLIVNIRDQGSSDLSAQALDAARRAVAKIR